MTPLRFGIVGCGLIAATHGAALRRLQAEGLAQLVAATDRNPGRAEAFTAKFGGTPCGTLDDLLARPDVDAVTLCTPSGSRGRMAAQAARAGKHVLSEKPLDVRVEAVDEAITAARKAGVTYGGIFQERFAPDAQKLKRAISAGAFGEIVLACVEIKWYRSPEYYKTAAWRGTWDLDGGAFSNQGIHSLDKAQWLAGEAVEVISATLKTGFHRDIEAETLGVATVRYASGALGTIAMTTLAYKGFPDRVDISGVKGSAMLVGGSLAHFATAEPYVDDAPPDDAAGDPAAEDIATERANNPAAVGIDLHLANLRDFVLAIRDGREPLVSATEARRAVNLVNLIYQKAGVGPYA